MGTENSSKETRKRAIDLSALLGRYIFFYNGFCNTHYSYHVDTNIDVVISSLIQLFVSIFGKMPKFRVLW